MKTTSLSYLITLISLMNAHTYVHELCFHADFEWTANYQMQFIQNANIGFMKIRSDPCTHC